MTERKRGALDWVLLTVRFLVEVALFVGALAVLVAAVGGGVGIVLGIVVVVALALLWGLLLSPRRRFDLPLGARVLVEALLMGAVAAGLAVTGHPGFAVALLVAEVVSVALLWWRGMPPGTDVGAWSSG